MSLRQCRLRFSHTAPRPGRGTAVFRSGPLESPTRLRAGSLHPGAVRPRQKEARRDAGTHSTPTSTRRDAPARPRVQERMACIKSAELRGRVPSAESRPRGFCLFDADSALSAVPEPSLGTAFGAGAGAGALGGGAAVGATPAPVQAPSDPRWLIGLGPGLYRPPPDDISACDGHSMHIGPSRPERKSLSRVVAARSTSPAKRVSASRCR